jgi:CheY-like chemotaxis protein
VARSRSSNGVLGRALAFLAPGKAAQRPAPARDEADVRKVISRLAGGVAHDLNNILLVVQGYAEMAVEEPDAGPTVRSLLTEMRDATARASLLVRDLLLVGERAPYTPRLLDLSEAIRRRLPAIAAECPEGIEVRSSLAEELRPVLADEDLVGRLLEALCARAREAMPAGGIMTISTESGASTEERTVVLRVHDTGTALSDEMRARIFEPYLPGPAGGKGQGLGMSVAYAAASRLGGTITARTVPDGTDIHVSMPAGSASATAAHAPRAAPARPTGQVEQARAPAGKTGETILVAEDDEGLRSLAVKVLAREGYAVLAARDGQEAVEIVERDGPNIRLALLDDVMPRMGGRAALARIQEIAPSLPVILCSGYAWHLDGDSSSGAGYWDILPKPWQPRELLQRVREGLESRR